MTTPQSIEPQYTLLTAVARLDELRVRESLAGAGSDAEALDRAELLELLALSEVVARKAAYGRQLTVRAARRGRCLLVPDRRGPRHQQAGRLGGAQPLDRRAGGGPCPWAARADGLRRGRRGRARAVAGGSGARADRGCAAGRRGAGLGWSARLASRRTAAEKGSAQRSKGPAQRTPAEPRSTQRSCGGAQGCCITAGKAVLVESCAVRSVAGTPCSAVPCLCGLPCLVRAALRPAAMKEPAACSTTAHPRSPASPAPPTPGVGARLMRRKPVESLVAEGGQGEGGSLRRSLGLWQLTMISIGATLGTGIFVVLGEAVPKAGPAVTVSFVIAGLTALFSALSYAELAGTIPVAGLLVLVRVRNDGRAHRLDLRLVSGPGVRRLGRGRRRRLGRVPQRAARRHASASPSPTRSPRRPVTAASSTCPR